MNDTFFCIRLLIKIKTHYKERYVCDAQESKFRRVHQFLQNSEKLLQYMVI